MTTTPSGHVYLVDDSSDVRLHLGDLLRRLGYSVSTFSSAEEFFNAPPSRGPSMVLMDMRMPGVNGLAAQARLTEGDRALPVVFISGESNLHEAIDAMKQGAIDFLCKPFGKEALVKAVDRALEVDRDQQATRRRLEALERKISGLSAREREIFLLMLQGHPNRDIAEITGVQAGTIKKHRAAVLEKMEVETTADLMDLCRGLPVEQWRAPATREPAHSSASQ